ncbi:MAG: adenylate kinase family protein [Archaeoglobaceae archaeon]|nr:adenylate kinase family protein [Archaeoglobaceae archaeon]MDW7989487.1 adenylate kinase family protein [Archaeoglobaceae archaeon]
MIALTGTPGCGKTSVAEELKRRGYRVISLKEFAEIHGCAKKFGEEIIVDLEKLSRHSFNGIIEGHLSHLLKPKISIVLRCNPLLIKKRLMERGWSYEKIMENVEAELIDLILVEAMQNSEKVYEIDTSDMTIPEIADAIEKILKGEEGFEPGKVDWISKLEDKIEEVTRYGGI